MSRHYILTSSRRPSELPSVTTDQKWYQFNQIGWRMLESNVFKWVGRTNRPLWVITGTWYDPAKPVRRLESGIGIPDIYYKVRKEKFIFISIRHF